MFIIVKVQGGEEVERRIQRMFAELPNPIMGEPTQIVILPWFTEFSELPRKLIEGLVRNLLTA